MAGTDREDDLTWSSPLETLQARAPAQPGLTVLWHPRPRRIGDQAVLVFDGDDALLGRELPEFFRAGSEVGVALEHQGLSRQPLRLRRDGAGGLDLHVPHGRMRCEIDGEPVAVDGDARIALSAARIARGVVIRLGGSVLLHLGLVGAVPQPVSAAGLVGVGRAVARVRAQIAQVAATELPVLILGETGTGKELVAQAVHAASARSHRALIGVNMATLSESLAAADLFGSVKGAYTGAHAAREGYFAEADGGSLFLDEIGDTPAPVQPMLLRAMETGEYRPLGGTRALRANVRLIAATDRDLGAHGFNQPLLRRLEAYPIAMPPLRERREDLGVLILHFLRQYAGADAALPELPCALVQTLCLHDWPGNVRQLGHAVRRLALAAAGGDWPDPGQWPPARWAHDRDDGAGATDSSPRAPVADQDAPQDNGATSATRYRSPRQVGEAEVLAALDASGWCVREAAQRLSVSRPSLYALIDACASIRRAEAIPDAELEAAVRAAPGDPALWAARLRSPRESLRRRVRALGLARAADDGAATD